MDIKFVEISYMYVKIVDIRLLIQPIIMGISKVFILIHHLYIGIMIEDNLNLIHNHYYRLRVCQIDQFYRMKDRRFRWQCRKIYAHF